MPDPPYITFLKRAAYEAEIREADKAFLRSCGIVPDFEPPHDQNRTKSQK
jgi:hypothetical protein